MSHLLCRLGCFKKYHLLKPFLSQEIPKIINFESLFPYVDSVRNDTLSTFFAFLPKEQKLKRGNAIHSRMPYLKNIKFFLGILPPAGSFPPPPKTLRD